MGWWNRLLGRKYTARDKDLYALFGGAETWAGERVSAEGAMNLSAFWACARITAQTIATLPFSVYERLPSGEKVSRSDHPLYRLLHDTPNADQTAVEFWEGRILGLCTTGNGYAEKVFNGLGNLIALNPMPSDTIVERLVSGGLRYKYQENGRERVLTEDKVFHIRGFGDGDVGMSPVHYARQTLGLAIATERATGNTFSKGLRSKGFFVMPPGTKLTQEQRVDAKKALVEANSGADAPWASILEGGVDFKPVNISHKDAEMILNRRFNVEEICRWLGVPPIVIGHAAEGQTMWGSGVEQIMQSWLTLGLRPYLKRTEQAAWKRLLTPAEQGRFFFEFNVEGLLRANSQGRAEFYSKMVQNGGMTPNEMRSKENLPSLPGGDQLLVNSTLIPLALAGAERSRAPTEEQP